MRTGPNEAERLLRSSPRFIEACSGALGRLEVALAERTQIFDSRLRRLSDDLRSAELQAFAIEEEFDLGIMSSVKAPSIRVDSVGVVILASTPLDESASDGGTDATF
jgi:hypothetical protein